jgi:predicted dithiol-disulfide oxidoreductase (DUF899 family)
MAFPPIVTEREWRAARDRLLVKEKDATRALDALAAERRRLPIVPIDKSYVFDGPAGAASLLDVFDGCRQLIVYHFMFAPGSDHRCPGCSSFVDNVGHLAHLHARDTNLVLVSRAPRAEIVPYQQRMGWNVPWYSSYGSEFNHDLGLTDQDFGLSVFLRGEDNRVFRSYFTAARGVDRLRMDFNLLDLTPLGRQETWEDSPPGWPQTSPYQWWRLHDEYAGEDSGPSDSRVSS